MSTVYLSLGANQGDRLEQLTQALQRLAAYPGIRLTGVSGVYETAPQGKTDQPDFLNCAAQVESELTPPQLLAAIREVEGALGRVRRERWGPRLIDIDILLYDALRLDLPELTIPHPRMAERAFVLIPLLELLPQVPGSVDRAHWEEVVRSLSDQGVQLTLDQASFFLRVKRVE